MYLLPVNAIRLTVICLTHINKQVCNFRMHELQLRIIEVFSEQNWQIISVVCNVRENKTAVTVKMMSCGM